MNGEEGQNLLSQANEKLINNGPTRAKFPLYQYVITGERSEWRWEQCRVTGQSVVAASVVHSGEYPNVEPRVGGLSSEVNQKPQQTRSSFVSIWTNFSCLASPRWRSWCCCTTAGQYLCTRDYLVDGQQRLTYTKQLRVYALHMHYIVDRRLPVLSYCYTSQYTPKPPCRVNSCCASRKTLCDIDSNLIVKLWLDPI